MKSTVQKLQHDGSIRGKVFIMGKKGDLSRGIWKSPEQRKETRLDMARARAVGEGNVHSKRQGTVRA